MNCPACGSPMKEHVTEKGVLFKVCSRYPKCEVSGTPALMALLQKPEETCGPVHLGQFVVKYAQLRIHQSKLKQAKTAEEREIIRKSALETMK